MKALVLGATGATGRLAVIQLISSGISARIIVREKSSLPKEFLGNDTIEIIKGNIDEISPLRMADLIKGCECVICCLGHRTTIPGMFGKPHKLVFNAIKAVIQAAENSGNGKIRLILMSTTGYTNRKLNEPHTMPENIVLKIVETLLPPHRDNMAAADFLLYDIGSANSKIEWIAIRPDTLIDRNEVSAYETVGSPTRSPVFNAGKTSRINVAHFMAKLAIDETLWQTWKYSTPVIYNKE